MKKLFLVLIPSLALAATEPINVNTSNGHVKKTSSGIGAPAKPFNFSDVTVTGLPGGGGGTPGGLNTQLQYNNAGAFGGVAPWTYNGTLVLAKTSATVLNFADNTDPTKIFWMDASGISTATTRKVTIANADSVTVVPDTGAANNFVTAISAAGAVSKAQPDFTNLSGTATDAQVPNILTITRASNLNTNGTVYTTGTNGTLNVATQFTYPTAVAAQLNGTGNNTSELSVVNSDTGTQAEAVVSTNGSSSAASLRSIGSGFTPFGAIVPPATWLKSSQPFWISASSKPINFSNDNATTLGLALNLGQTVASGASVTLDEINVPAVTSTVTGGTNITTATGFNKTAFYRPTYTDSSAVTVTNAATLWIENSPAAAGSLTITNPYALWVDNGVTRLDGSINLSGSIGTGTDCLKGGASPSWGACGGGSPGGSNTQVQFNDGGVFGGDAGMTYTKSIPKLTLSGGATNDSRLTIGSFEFQPYAVNNCWMGDNVYFDGSVFKYRANGGAGQFYFLGTEGQFRFYATGTAGTTVSSGSTEFKVNTDGTVAIGGGLLGGMSTAVGNYTNSLLLIRPPTVATQIGIASNYVLGWTGTTNDASATIDTGFDRNASGIIGTNNGTAGQWAALKVGTRDATTNATSDGLTVAHNSTGTPANGLGSAILFNIESSTTEDTNAARIAAAWEDVTHASRKSYLSFQTSSSGAPAEQMRLSAAGGLAIGQSVNAANGIVDAKVGFKLTGSEFPIAANGLVKRTAANTYAAATLGTDYLDSSYISDTAFASSWDAVTTIAPSKNAVYDQFIASGAWDGVLKVSGSDATTTGQTLVDVTGLVTPTLSNSTKYEIEAVLDVTTSAVTTGCSYGVQTGGSGGAGVVSVILTGNTTGTTASSEGLSTTPATASTARLLTSGQAGTMILKGEVTTRGAGTANISIQHLKVTSGTSTVKIGSVLKYRKL